MARIKIDVEQERALAGCALFNVILVGQVADCVRKGFALRPEEAALLKQMCVYGILVPSAPSELVLAPHLVAAMRSLAGGAADPGGALAEIAPALEPGMIKIPIPEGGC